MTGIPLLRPSNLEVWNHACADVRASGGIVPILKNAGRKTELSRASWRIADEPASLPAAGSREPFISIQSDQP